MGHLLGSDTWAVAISVIIPFVIGVVDSVFGRVGVVVAVDDDYDASQVQNTPAGGIAATDVQAAINELDTEKAPLASPTFTGLVTAPTTQINGPATVQIDAISTAIVDGSEDLALVNITPAAQGGAQQYSPALRWLGSGWKADAVSASQTVEFRSYAAPVQGASEPISSLIWDWSVNGAAYQTAMALNINLAVGGANVPLLGIGTNDPQRSLHLKASNTGTQTLIALENPDLSDGSGCVISYRGQTNGVGGASFIEFGAMVVKYTEHDHPTSASDFEFWTRDAGTLTKHLTINAAGSVFVGPLSAPTTTITGLLTAPTTQVNGPLTVQVDNVDEAVTDGSEDAALVNTTTAAAGAQQYSPALRWLGSGWKTDAVAASQPVEIRSYLVPVQGSAAPSGHVVFEVSINGGAYTQILLIDSDGNIDAEASLFLTEQAAAGADTAGKGQFWVKDDVPNIPKFTDDASTDFDIVLDTKAQTLTSKRITKRVTTVASSATPTPNHDTDDLYDLTALAAAAELQSPGGTPTEGQPLLIRIKDDGTGRALTYNAIYRAVGVTLPVTTVASKTIYLMTIYNANDTKVDVVGVTEEA